MSYTFPSFTDDELNAPNLMEKGRYPFEVSSSARQTSKAGNPMAKLMLKLWDKEGKNHTLFDYLIFSAVPLNIKKVKNFSYSVGLIEEYKKRELPEELAHYCGYVEIGIEDEKPNPNGGMYPRKNKVIDYVRSEKGAVNHQIIEQNKDEFMDDIPF